MGRFSDPRRGRRLRWLFAGAAVCLGCASVPFASPTYEVESVAARGPYLDARLAWASSLREVSSDGRLGLLFEDTEPCRSLLSVGEEVEYLPEGFLGRVRRGDASCRAVGITDLAGWRDRRPRAPGRDALPRGQASFTVVHRDAEFAWVRGSFPQVSLVGWAGGYDTLALLARGPACESALERGVASVEFRTGGDAPLRLVSPAGPCVIEALAIPDLSVAAPPP